MESWKENFWKDLIKFEVKVTERQKKTCSLENQLQKRQNVKRKLNNMKQVMDTEKFNEFSFLNQEEEITSRWSQSSPNAAS